MFALPLREGKAWVWCWRWHGSPWDGTSGWCRTAVTLLILILSVLRRPVSFIPWYRGVDHWDSEPEAFAQSQSRKVAELGFPPSA